MKMDSVSYELGVMMYNVAIDQETNEYDLDGNFKGFVNALGDSIDKDFLKDGFISEGQNYNTNTDLEVLFERAFEHYIA